MFDELADKKLFLFSLNKESRNKAVLHEIKQTTCFFHNTIESAAKKSAINLRAQLLNCRVFC